MEFTLECMKDANSWEIYNIVCDLKVEERIAMGVTTIMNMQEIAMYEPKIKKMKEAFGILSFWGIDTQNLVKTLLTNPSLAKEIYYN